jgi:hypothetical protein
MQNDHESWCGNEAGYARISHQELAEAKMALAPLLPTGVLLNA